MTFSNPTLEVTQHHSYHILFIKAAIGPVQVQHERTQTLPLNVRCVKEFISMFQNHHKMQGWININIVYLQNEIKLW